MILIFYFNTCIIEMFQTLENLYI